MYKCNNCNKEFEFESEYNRHKNRKTYCIKNNNFNCNICNKKFKYESKLFEHKKTKKHIINVNNLNNQDNNILDISKDNIINEKDNIIKELTNKKDNIIKELTNKIKLLEIENNELKCKNKIHHNIEYIYIIHPIQCINTNIYKIGRSNNIINRHKQYPKGSELLFSISCKKSKILEQNILNFLKDNSNYIQIKKYGNEYFQCNLEMLINDIHNIVQN